MAKEGARFFVGVGPNANVELWIISPEILDIFLGHEVEFAPLGHADAVADKVWLVWYAVDFNPVYTTRGWEYKLPDGFL